MNLIRALIYRLGLRPKRGIFFSPSRDFIYGAKFAAEYFRKQHTKDKDSK